MMRRQPLIDSDMHGQRCQTLLDGPRSKLVLVAQDTLDILRNGSYVFNEQSVNIAAAIQDDIDSVVSIPPMVTLPQDNQVMASEDMTVQVENTLTITAAKSLIMRGKRPLVLNFANGTHVGGGFLRGAKAQEETLCYVSTLFCSILDNPFYQYNAQVKNNKSSDYVILSRATVFRDEAYELIESPWHMDVITCAAPIARFDWNGVSQTEGERIMDQRIARVLDIAVAYGFTDLVLGAWGCGAFGNDPAAISKLFEQHLLQRAVHFDTVVFAIADWSTERRFIQPFAARFSLDLEGGVP